MTHRTHHHNPDGGHHDPHTSGHVPLRGVIHQPADPDHSTGAHVTTGATAAGDYLPTVTHHAGQPPPHTVVVINPPAQSGEPGAGRFGALGGWLLIGAGIGAGAILALVAVGSLLLATLQALAATALAIGGMAFGLAVAAVVLLHIIRR